MLSSASADRLDAVGLGVEALGLLVVASVLRRAVPMRRWAGLLGVPHPPTELGSTPITPATGREGDIGLAVGRAAARLPHGPTCLDRVVAAQVMLRRRGRPGVAVIGLAPERQWNAHAWLVGRTGVVVGADEASRFAPATIFR